MSEVLRVEHMMKRFPGVLAVNDVSFSLDKGEVLALLGENGAGKSTITKIICGAQKPDAGEVYIEGEKVQFESAREAMNKGIGMVYQGRYHYRHQRSHRPNQPKPRHHRLCLHRFHRSYWCFHCGTRAG